MDELQYLLAVLRQRPVPGDKRRFRIMSRYVITTSFYRDMPEDYCIAISYMTENFFNVHGVPQKSGRVAEDLFDFEPLREGKALTFPSSESAYYTLDMWRALVCDWRNANERRKNMKKHLEWADDVLVYLENLLVVEVEQL